MDVQDCEVECDNKDESDVEKSVRARNREERKKDRVDENGREGRRE